MKGNYQRLTVHLNNLKKEKNFTTTYTYKDIPNENEAVACVLTMHSETTDTNQDIQRKIKSARYNGKPLALFTKNDTTRNGWLLKD